jgi:hypothetical protein
MAVYAPMSPRSGYEPSSPRAGYVPMSPRVGVSRPSFIQGIIDNMKVPIRNINFKDTWRPIANYKEYLQVLERHERSNAASMTPEKGEKYLIESLKRISEIRERHEKWEADNPPREPTPTKEPINVPDDMDHVVVNLKVLKSGKVKVHMSAPMNELYVNYYKKFTRPPIDVHLKALKRFGYPDWVLERVLRKHEKLPEKLKEMDEMIERVFGKYSSSKPSKPKKKTVVEAINTKMRQNARANKSKN